MGQTTAILVSALLAQNGRALLTRRQNGIWELPTEPLAEHETTEETLVRLLREQLGLEATDEEFLETYYERDTDGGAPLIRNVYRVTNWQGVPLSAPSGDYIEVRWVAPEDLSGLAPNETLRCILGDGLAAGPVAPPGAPIMIVTGPPAAGKSTVARAIGACLERAAHVEVDSLREMVISGYASPVPPLGDPTTASEQFDLAVANSVALARNFSLAGYQVLLDDVIVSAEQFDRRLEAFAGVGEVYLVTLLPDDEILQRRDEGRAPELRMGRRCQELSRAFASNREARGLRLDSSRMTPEETAKFILAHREHARVL